jgi:phenylalanyl-tRNA synthetase beta chain
MFELALDAVLQRPMPRLPPVSRQQPVERDIAVVVAERVTHADLMQSVRRGVHRRPAAHATCSTSTGRRPAAEGQAACAPRCLRKRAWPCA